MCVCVFLSVHVHVCVWVCGVRSCVCVRSYVRVCMIAMMMMIKWDNHLCVIEFSGVSSNEAEGAAEVIELFQTTIDCQHLPHDADEDDADEDHDEDDDDGHDDDGVHIGFVFNSIIIIMSMITNIMHMMIISTSSAMMITISKIIVTIIGFSWERVCSESND